MASLPSEDVEISASNKSVQWLFDVNQDTNRSSQIKAPYDHVEEEKMSASKSTSSIISDVNDREEIDDL